MKEGLELNKHLCYSLDLTKFGGVESKWILNHIFYQIVALVFTRVTSDLYTNYLILVTIDPAFKELTAGPKFHFKD